MPTFALYALDTLGLWRRPDNSRAGPPLAYTPIPLAADQRLSSTPLDGACRALLIHRFVRRDIAGVNTVLAGLPGTLARLRIDVVDNARAAEAAPVWRVDRDGTSRFRFHEKSWAQHPHEIFGRWLDTLPLIAAVQAADPSGSCVLNLGDEGHRPGLAFDGAGPQFTLVPDCFFIRTNAYAGLAQTYRRRALPWAERRPVVFWRGTTTGRETSLDALPRVRMCRAAQGLGEQADVGFSAASQQFVGAEPWLRARGLLRDFVSNMHYDQYQLHLSIDGNASPWLSLAKMHTGSPVLKVTSPRGFRQWYYRRLVPWENYVPIRSDLADLHDTVRMLLADPARARRIGLAGQELARSMSCEVEIARAVPSALGALQPDAGTTADRERVLHLAGHG